MVIIHDLYDDYIFNLTSGCYAFVCDFKILILTLHDYYDDYIFNLTSGCYAFVCDFIFNLTSGCYAFVCDFIFLIQYLFEVLLLVQSTILDS